MNSRLILKILLWVGALFFLSEFFFHFFGLPILEHDKIFIPTHDRYIAIFALTYSALLFFMSFNLKNVWLFFITMGGILISIINAMAISLSGGYAKFFPVAVLDKQLGYLGIGVYIWYFLVLVLWLKNFWEK